MDKQFDKTIDWKAGHRLCKVYLKKDKNGQPYFMGDFNPNNVLTVRKKDGKFAKEGEYEIQIFPVRFSPKETKSESFGENFGGNGKPGIEFAPGDTEEVPF